MYSLGILLSQFLTILFFHVQFHLLLLDLDCMFLWNFLAFYMIQWMLAIRSLVLLPFLIQFVHPEVLGSSTFEA